MGVVFLDVPGGSCEQWYPAAWSCPWPGPVPVSCPSLEFTGSPALSMEVWEQKYWRR